MPAKAGIQKYFKKLDFRFRGNDAKGRLRLFTKASILVLE